MSKDDVKSGAPIINAHTHTFTQDHTPKYLAKTILPWPFYKWLETDVMLKKLKKYLDGNKKEYSDSGKMEKWEAYLKKKDRAQSTVFRILNFLFMAVVWIIFTYYLLDLILPLIRKMVIVGWLAAKFYALMDPVLPNLGSKLNSVLILSLMVLGFKNVRQAVWSYLLSRIKKAIGKDRVKFFLHYFNIVRFTYKSRQANIFNDLQQQYPQGSKFVILPMDMEHMDAGPVVVSYPEQMEEVLRLKSKNKDTVYPFIFVDPRRIEQQDPNKPFLKINTTDPYNLILDPCLVAEYFDGGCTGIKIYPALGYYVFAKELLPLWLYCVQNNIPITTHCSIGPIYYRGKLQDLGEDYDLHPIFKEQYGKDEQDERIIKPLRLAQLKNKDFQVNFTHPLNYVCLLHKPLLIEVLEYHDDKDLYELFGYQDGDIARDLSGLKINLAHYGSADHWDQFLTQDRFREANAVIKNPKVGLDIPNSLTSLKKVYDLWHYIDWYSIISSMILNFENVYADISYTAHDLAYLNLLSETIDNPIIGQRVLFGTDFYVVTNHKTEKQFWIDMQNTLGPQRWGLIANQNPARFLTSNLPGSL